MTEQLFALIYIIYYSFVVFYFKSRSAVSQHNGKKKDHEFIETGLLIFL